MMVYSRQKNRIAGFSDMIHGGPTVSADFHFARPAYADRQHMEATWIVG